MSDAETLQVYAARAQDYTNLTKAGDQSEDDLAAFLAALPSGREPLLDWGAGPGHHAARMAMAGHQVVCTDATPEMVALQKARGLEARLEPFEALPRIPTYRGIWANFSLLHAEADALPHLIRRASDALHPNGVFHVGMKRGTGTARDELGRRYTYVEREDLDQMTATAGLTRLRWRHGSAAGLSGHAAGYVIHQSRKADA